MKVIVLVVASDDQPCYEHHRAVWRERWDLHPSFECKFVQMHDGPTEDRGETFFVQGAESLHPGILDKTLAAFRHYHDKGYDFILRTNLSSLWLFDRFLPVVESMPRAGVYAGTHCDFGQTPFVSGAGMLLSPDVARLVADNAHLNTTNFVDDVDIGAILAALGVAPRNFTNCSHTDHAAAIDPTHFHYYVKGAGDRCLEGGVMRRIAQACKEWDSSMERMPQEVAPDTTQESV